MSKTATTLRRSVPLLIRIGVVVALLGGFVFLWGAIQEVRRNTFQQRSIVDRRIDDIGRLTLLRDQLKKTEHDVSRLKVMVPTKDSLGDVLSEIEKEALRFNVEISVPEVQQEKEKESDLLLSSVRLKVTVVGEPVDVLAYFHALENLPYLSEVKTFDFSTTKIISPSGGVALVPQGDPLKVSARTSESSIASELRMDLLVALREE